MAVDYQVLPKMQISILQLKRGHESRKNIYVDPGEKGVKEQIYPISIRSTKNIYCLFTFSFQTKHCHK